MGGDLEQNIKQSFSKVKEDIYNLSEEIDKIRVELQENKESLKLVLSKVVELKEELKALKNQGSTGNEGVNQSINHLINQSITNQSFNQSDPTIEQNKESTMQNMRNEGVNHLINQSLINQSINHEGPLKEITHNISKIFSSLSKQELKLFLTIYQLEDENIEPSYKNLSLRMQLSEHCIRSHLSSLLKKNAPILKKRLNNHTNLLSVQRDFKVLNLKQRLIGLYYDSDPNQKTLFDL